MIKRITESPTITDTILFELATPDADGLLSKDPLCIEKVVIYHIERDFNRLNNNQAYEMVHYDPAVEKEVVVAKEAIQKNPTAENVEKLRLAKLRMEAMAVRHNFYFNDAKPVYTKGNKENPIWSADDPTNSPIKAIVKNQHGQEQFGQFEFQWDATGGREGDYFISWSWRMDENQPLFSSHQIFRLESVRGTNSYIPMRHTPRDKYDVLIDRYLPETYHYKIKHDNLTPEVISRLNKCVAQGFTGIEDLANQLMDIYDANTTHETILPLLGNFFNLQLRSSDVTLWRRQIKQAIDLYKAKGTLQGLTEALDQAGIRLVKFTHLWQVVSEYIWTDGFVITQESEQKFIQGDESVPLEISQFLGNLSNTPHDGQIKQVLLRSNKEWLSVPVAAARIIESFDDDHPILIWEGAH